MGSKIEWTDETWNPFRGCFPVSQGCKHCYAEDLASRFSSIGYWGHGLISNQRWNGNVHFIADALRRPLSWRRPRKIFVNSVSDTFHKNVQDDWLDMVFAVITLCPQHIFQILTKRPDRMSEYLNSRDTQKRIVQQIEQLGFQPIDKLEWPLPNVWVGTSIESQGVVSSRLNSLVQVPAKIRFVSCEPLLGPVKISDFLDKVNWVIVGGESGRHARPMHPAWIRSLRDQCISHKVSFFFKQWGEWCPERHAIKAKEACVCRCGHWWGSWDDNAVAHHTIDCTEVKTGANAPITVMFRVGKKVAGCELNGFVYEDYPE